MRTKVKHLHIARKLFYLINQLIGVISSNLIGELILHFFHFHLDYPIVNLRDIQSARDTTKLPETILILGCFLRAYLNSFLFMI